MGEIPQLINTALGAKDLFGLVILAFIILFTFMAHIPLIIRSLRESAKEELERLAAQHQREMDRQTANHKEERLWWNQAMERQTIALEKLEATTNAMSERQTVALEKLGAATNAMVAEMKDMARHRPHA